MRNDKKNDSSYSTVVASRARLLDTRALRLLQTLGNDIDGYAWTVRSWLYFDVADQLASVEIPAMLRALAGRILAGHTRWKKGEGRGGASKRTRGGRAGTVRTRTAVRSHRRVRRRGGRLRRPSRQGGGDESEKKGRARTVD